MMKDGYLSKVLRAAYMTTVSAKNWSDPWKKPPSPRLQLQQRIQDNLRFSTMPLANENETQDVAEDFFSEEDFGNAPPFDKSQRMDAQQAERQFESDHQWRNPTTNATRDIEAVSFSQDNPLPVRKYADVNWPGRTEPNVEVSDVKREKKEQKKDARRLQETEDRIDTRNPQVKDVQSRERDRIPTDDAVKEYAIRIPGSNRFDPSGSASRLVEKTCSDHALNVSKTDPQRQTRLPERDQSTEPLPLRLRTTRVPELPTEQVRAYSAEDEQVDRRETLVPAREIVRRPTSRQQHQKETAERRQSSQPLHPRTRTNPIPEPLREQKWAPGADEEQVVRPIPFIPASETSQRPANRLNLNGLFFTRSLKKTEAQMAKITKDVASINEKLDQHMRDEQRKPAVPKFLPERPVGHNLGGWSNLARRYIR